MEMMSCFPIHRTSEASALLFYVFRAEEKWKTEKIDLFELSIGENWLGISSHWN